MSIFAGARKCDLKILAEELGETVNDNHKLKDLKKMILTSKEYDEESAKEWLNTIINERKEREENEIRKEEIAEQKRQEEISERKRKEEQENEERKRKEEQEYEERKRKEEQEYEERKRKDEMEFELQKIRIGAEDDWSKLNSPDDLVEKLDDYQTLRSTFRSKQPRKEGHYDKRNSFKDDPAIATNEKKKLHGITHNERGCSCCLLKISVAQKLKLKLERAVNKIYGFGNQKMPALTSIGRIKADIEVDNVKAKNISIYVVPDDAQSFDLIIGRIWLDLPHIAYTKMGKRVHIGYREDELFRNFPIDEKVNGVCLKRLETSQLENESLQIKDSSQQKMVCNLANDLKTVKNELRLLQGDIKDFKKEHHSLFLQIQENKKHVENLKSINDSLVKTNAYYDIKKSGKVSLRKGDIVAVRRNSNTTGESTKTQPRYRGPMVVTEILPSDTYRISQLEPSNGHPYVTIAHVSQLKAWRSWNEDDDDSSENSDDEPEMQRPKRTVRKPKRYGAYMPDN
ncbi:hypothetical protein AVEN_199965-1 [Araneus ventricosus]|uniref:Uncharacterized protein n=1 Tax=Araneus ventricosus TaxID=182803 RepID=A0A4Y2BUX7_ARAVE|nr:hypothetical protein AVEN_199965-1 [Araneus ventricosus]